MSNKKEKNTTFTEGKILQPLILFALPVLFALFLQAMYGAVDLLIVGKFASSADVSAVSTGSQVMMTLTNLVSSFAMGTTVLLGQQIGCGDRKKGGETVGTAIILFAAIAVIMTVILVIFAPQISGIMNAPTEAFDKTVNYVRICGSGMLVIIAYNLIGCIFRGLGDSRTPLVTVAIACVCNIAGDLLLCAGFRMGTEGAAFATVFAQVISVVISFWLISRKSLPFELHRENIRINRNLLKKMTGLGAPIALQDLLAGIFSSDPEVIAAAVQYLRAYGIDCLFTAIFFCYTGFYNGIGMTRFVMIQGIVGAFGVRVPFSYFMSKQSWATLFHIGLATPFSSVLQLILCVGCMLYLKKKRRV